MSSQQIHDWLKHLKSRIDPRYENVRWTESHERKVSHDLIVQLLHEIERLRSESK